MNSNVVFIVECLSGSWTMGTAAQGTEAATTAGTE